MNNLDQLREISEKNFTVATVVDQVANYNRVLVILNLRCGKYRCHRYVLKDHCWTLEVDWQSATIPTVLSWLSFPMLNKSKTNKYGIKDNRREK